MIRFNQLAYMRRRSVLFHPNLYRMQLTVPGASSFLVRRSWFVVVVAIAVVVVSSIVRCPFCQVVIFYSNIYRICTLKNTNDLNGPI